MHLRFPIICGVLLLTFSGCGKEEKGEVANVTPSAPQAVPVKSGEPDPFHLSDIPPESLVQVLSANRLGIGYLERFEYSEATKQFRLVRKLAPDWTVGMINLSIALLNESGVKSEAARQTGADASEFANNFQEALALMDIVLKRDPNNLHARYCRGIILHYLTGDLEHPENIIRAHNDFQAVVNADPNDGYSWYKLAMTVWKPDPETPSGGLPAGPQATDKKIQYLSKAFELAPYLTAVLHELHLTYRLKGDLETQKKLIARWYRLNTESDLAAPGEKLSNAYGEAGKYANALDPLGPRSAEQKSVEAPKFDIPAPIKITLPDGCRWVKASDFTGKFAIHGRVRQRFGATSAAFDANGDGKTDLFLPASIVGPKGLRDALLLNEGDGKFSDATEQLRFPLDRASLGVAAADFDADRRVDLFLTGVGDNRLLRNDAKKGFEDVTKLAGIAPSNYVSLTARFMDFDQDGDIDLYVVNHTLAANANDAFTDKSVPPVPNSAFRNDGKPEPAPPSIEANWTPIAVSTDTFVTKGLKLAFSVWSTDGAITGGEANHVGLALLDVDNDRDIDLVLADDDKPLNVVLNDRLGEFHSVKLDTLGAAKRNGLLSADFDKDGQVDIVSVEASGKTVLYHNASTRVKTELVARPGPNTNWRSALATDFDLDTWTDLIGLPIADQLKPLSWLRNEGKDHLVPLDVPLAPEGESAIVGLNYADLGGDPLPDFLMLREGEAPRVALNRGNGRTWVAITLGGRWKPHPDHMRSNAEGLGTRISIEGDGLDVRYDHATPSTSLGQSATPVVLGLGSAKQIQLIHLRWPDGVLQCELNMPVATTHNIAEYNRKTGSCPVLFTWNGEQFVCLGDFLGGGGLGYLVAPGIYSQPDRDEAVAIAPDQLKAVDGIFRLAITEPMDEIAYLDHLMLEVVDRPPGINTTLDERFAPEGPRPTGELVAWSQSIAPVKATDHAGRDITDRLKAWDRRTVDQFSLLRGWIGYAEDHAIVLDFGDRLAQFGPTDPLVLCLAGWVEYPYSQTNFAAATAGTALKPPVLERKNATGQWEVITPSMGYPAGLPRMMTLDLTGKLTGKSCELRIRTNMECYWDQAFIAVRQPTSSVKSVTLSVLAVKLGYRGYTREISPDGRLPLIYDYNYVDPAPLAHLSGMLTRFGDVTKLLQADDDQLCLVGPGDEVRVEFDGRQLPALPSGWTRSYVLRSVGYCKDADPFTATSDNVGPLPWKGMPDFPFKKPASRPSDSTYDAYLREYQTRPATTR